MSTRVDPGDDEGQVTLLCPERSAGQLHGHSPLPFFQYSFPKLKTLKSKENKFFSYLCKESWEQTFLYPLIHNNLKCLTFAENDTNVKLIL